MCKSGLWRAHVRRPRAVGRALNGGFFCARTVRVGAGTVLAPARSLRPDCAHLRKFIVSRPGPAERASSCTQQVALANVRPFWARAVAIAPSRVPVHAAATSPEKKRACCRRPASQAPARNCHPNSRADVSSPSDADGVETSRRSRVSRAHDIAVAARSRPIGPRRRHRYAQLFPKAALVQVYRWR